MGERIKSLRAAKGFTQEQLAQQAELTVSTIAQMERGKMRNPRLDTLRGLAKALGVTLDELAGDEP